MITDNSAPECAYVYTEYDGYSYCGETPVVFSGVWLCVEHSVLAVVE